MKIHVVRYYQPDSGVADSNCEQSITIDYPVIDGQRPMALDVLLAAQHQYPDLSHRYGCRNGLCGVCTVNVNGRARLACRTKVRDGDTLSAMAGLPVVRDLVVRRDQVNRQLQQRLPQPAFDVDNVRVTTDQQNDESQQSQKQAAYDSLNRCIECYACLDGCPMHARNGGQLTLTSGNPYAMLRVRQVQVNPHASGEEVTQAQTLAQELGLDACLDCKGCRCGVGIDLMKEVIKPLIEHLES